MPSHPNSFQYNCGFLPGYYTVMFLASKPNIPTSWIIWFYSVVFVFLVFQMINTYRTTYVCDWVSDWLADDNHLHSCLTLWEYQFYVFHSVTNANVREVSSSSSSMSRQLFFDAGNFIQWTSVLRSLMRHENYEMEIRTGENESASQTHVSTIFLLPEKKMAAKIMTSEKICEELENGWWK